MELDIAAMQRRIADTRKARRLSLQQLADSAGLSKGYVWELERGNVTNPTVNSVWVLSKALCVSPAYLLGIDPNEPPIDPLALELAALVQARLAARTPATPKETDHG